MLRDPDFPHPFLPVSTLLLLRLVNTVTEDLNCGNGEEVLGVPGEGRPQRQQAVMHRVRRGAAPGRASAGGLREDHRRGRLGHPARRQPGAPGPPRQQRRRLLLGSRRRRQPQHRLHGDPRGLQVLDIRG